MTPTYEGPGHARRLSTSDKPDALRAPWRAWDVKLMPQPPGPWDPAWDAAIGQWLIHAPGSHPLWSWYVMHGVHLRPIPGVRPAKLHRPTSSHEFIIMALNPECGDPDPANLFAWIDAQRAAKRPHWLDPFDLVHQVDGATDEIATETLRLFIRAVCDGQTSPESDFRSWNEQLLDGTVAHMLEGHHLPS